MQKRDHDEELNRSGEMAALETARSAAETGSKAAAEPPKEEHISLFWRVFGGTILSIVALVSITLYTNLTSSISELRAEVSREREARAELVKKDEFNNRSTSMYERMRAIDATKVELEGMKEKVNSNATALSAAKKDNATALEAVKKETTASTDSLKKDVAAVEVLKERVAVLEGVKKDIAGLDALKEKLTATATDLKTIRDDLTKLAADVEKNKASDIERKTSRDAQYKQVDEALKELQKGLQDCREKLARLEGAKPMPGDFPLPFARPMAPPPSVSKPAPASPPSVESAPGEVKPAGGTTAPGAGKPGPDGE